jgi:diacylglycerol kinase (ATP)
MKNQPFHRRLRFALTGIRAAFQTEASFRVQCGFAGSALVLLLVLRPKPIWWALILLVSAAILAAELMNTALEFVTDRLHPEVHPMIARAKDCAAGAVLVLSVAAIGIAAALLLDS